MRFDRAVWSSMPGVEAAGYWMACVVDRARRFCSALDAAGVPYAVCGGLSVMAWVASRDESLVRTTKDVDVLMRRADLARAAAALTPHGFTLTEVSGVHMFLDGPEGTPATAVHIILAGEPTRPHDPSPVPELGAGHRDEHAPWVRVEVERLLHMKLLAMRPHDIAHIADLMRVGLVDPLSRDRVPETLRSRFDRALEQYVQHYRDSPH
ncbi:MAG: hypothetical protein FGM37_02110 [Phycisphaerales bacterium]|nr:hypothetical protein [Phycisphaerales bacterium]